MQVLESPRDVEMLGSAVSTMKQALAEKQKLYAQLAAELASSRLERERLERQLVQMQVRSHLSAATSDARIFIVGMNNYERAYRKQTNKASAPYV